LILATHGMRRYLDAMLSSPLCLPMSTAPHPERPDFPVSWLRPSAVFERWSRAERAVLPCNRAASSACTAVPRPNLFKTTAVLGMTLASKKRNSTQLWFYIAVVNPRGNRARTIRSSVRSLFRDGACCPCQAGGTASTRPPSVPATRSGFGRSSVQNGTGSKGLGRSSLARTATRVY
jgi:hypothetical protein